jgi:predicted GTPase
MKTYRFADIQSKIHESNLLRPIDVLLVGSTGVGKSSTLNALFGSEIAKVGYGVEPETKEISEYSFHDYFRVHDSAGLGDGKSADINHSKNIISALLRSITINEKMYGFMDLALVLLDGGSRDLGTTFHLLETVILKNISPERVIVAINQADMGMKGRYWNASRRQPEPELLQFLEEKTNSAILRLKEATGLQIKKPVYYSASNNYNIEKLMDHIIRHFPTSRRLLT